MVVTSAPSTNDARYRHPDTARPFTSTVQQPQSPWPQDSRAPLRPKCTCRSSIRLWCGATLAVTSRPLSMKLMMRCPVISRFVQRPAGLRPQRAIHRLRTERQLGQANANRVVDRIRDRRRNTKGRNFAHAFGTERTVVLDIVDPEVFHRCWEVANAWNLVVR